LIKFLCPSRQRIGHVGDVLASQSLGLVLKKQKPTQRKQATLIMYANTKTKNGKPKQTHKNETSLCTTVMHNAAQGSSDYFPS